MPTDVGSEAALNFVRQLLQEDPRKRMTAQDALKHPYMQFDFSYSKDRKDEARMSPLQILHGVSTAPLTAHVSLMSNWASPASPASPHPANGKGSSKGPPPNLAPDSRGSPKSTLEQPPSPVSPEPAKVVGGPHTVPSSQTSGTSSQTSDGTSQTSDGTSQTSDGTSQEPGGVSGKSKKSKAKKKGKGKGKGRGK
jgi:serine/threonine protein kinase